MLLAVCAPSYAQQMEPGEWQFTTITTSPGEKPETETEKECLKKEDVADKTRPVGALPPGCKLTPGKKTANSEGWEISCPSTGLRQSYTVRWTRTTFDVDIESVSPGEKPVRLKTTGKRLGACPK